MAGLTPKEKLQPSLLDRLTDLRPDVRTNTAGVRVLSVDELREGVRRDLGALFNATALETVAVEEQHEGRLGAPFGRRRV